MNIYPPKNLSLNQLLPEKPVLLMGAGPVPIPDAVAKANGLVISHLGETMSKVIASIQSMGQYVFQTKSTKIFGISGPSSAAMEMAATSLMWPGRKVLVLNLGTFSARFSELARGLGANVTELAPKEFAAFHADDVLAILKDNHFDVLTIVQGETSCGIKNIHLPEIVKAAKEQGVMTIVDAVCTLTTMPFLMDEWEIDVALTGGQKGLSSIAGVSLIAFSEKAWETISAREEVIPHWCLDPRRAFKFWGKNEYHYTAPVSGILALHEALRIICEETLEVRFNRHTKSSESLQKALQIMGLELFAPAEFRLNSVVAIKNVNNVNTKELISHMIKVHSLEVSGSFGLDIIRVGQMGEQCRPENVRRVIEALGLGYKHFGVELDFKAGLTSLI